jgi:hypothetical protein
MRYWPFPTINSFVTRTAIFTGRLVPSGSVFGTAFQSNFAKCLCDRSSTPPPLGGGAARQIASELMGQLNSDGWMNLDAMIKTFDAQ